MGNLCKKTKIQIYYQDYQEVVQEISGNINLRKINNKDFPEEKMDDAFKGARFGGEDIDDEKKITEKIVEKKIEKIIV